VVIEGLKVIFLNTLYFELLWDVGFIRPSVTKQTTGSLKATSLEHSVFSLIGLEWLGVSDLSDLVLTK